MKPEITTEYVSLCSHSVSYTNNLFGDDVSKVAKDMKDCSKERKKTEIEVEASIEVVEEATEVATVEEEVDSDGQSERKKFQRGGNLQNF